MCKIKVSLKTNITRYIFTTCKPIFLMFSPTSIYWARNLIFIHLLTSFFVFYIHPYPTKHTLPSTPTITHRRSLSSPFSTRISPTHTEIFPLNLDPPYPLSPACPRNRRRCWTCSDWHHYHFRWFFRHVVSTPQLVICHCLQFRKD